MRSPRCRRKAIRAGASGVCRTKPGGSGALKRTASRVLKTGEREYVRPTTMYRQTIQQHSMASATKRRPLRGAKKCSTSHGQPLGRRSATIREGWTQLVGRSHTHESQLRAPGFEKMAWPRLSMPPAVVAVALSHAVSQDVADDAPDAPPAQIAQHAGMRDSAPARSDGMSELLALVAIMCAKDRQAFRRGCHQQSLSSVDTDVRRSDIRTRAQRGQARFGPPETCSETLRRAFCPAKLHRMTRASHARPAGSGCSGTDPRRS